MTKKRMRRKKASERADDNAHKFSKLISGYALFKRGIKGLNSLLNLKS